MIVNAPAEQRERLRQRELGVAPRIDTGVHIDRLVDRVPVALTPKEQGAWTILALPTERRCAAVGTRERWLRFMSVKHAHGRIIGAEAKCPLMPLSGFPSCTLWPWRSSR